MTIDLRDALRTTAETAPPVGYEACFNRDAIVGRAGESV